MLDNLDAQTATIREALNQLRLWPEDNPREFSLRGRAKEALDALVAALVDRSTQLEAAQARIHDLEGANMWERAEAAVGREATLRDALQRVRERCDDRDGHFRRSINPGYDSGHFARQIAEIARAALEAVGADQ